MYHFDICVALVFFSNSWINYILEQELPTDGTVIFSAPHTHSSATFTPFLTLERAWGALKVGRIIWDIPSPTLPSWPHWHGLAESSLFAWHLLSRSLTFHTVSMCLGSFSQPCLPHVCMPVLQKPLPHLGAVQMPGQARGRILETEYLLEIGNSLLWGLNQLIYVKCFLAFTLCWVLFGVWTWDTDGWSKSYQSYGSGDHRARRRPLLALPLGYVTLNL